MPLAVARDAARNWTQAFLKKLEGLGRGHLAALPVGASEGPDSLVVENDGKAESIFLHSITAGQNLHEALQAALDETIAGLPIPKVMSYQLADGVTTVQFVRPVHRLVALHGHEVVPVHALGLSAGTKTHGHRFMCKGEIALHSADDLRRADGGRGQGDPVVRGATCSASSSSWHERARAHRRDRHCSRGTAR